MAVSKHIFIIFTLLYFSFVRSIEHDTLVAIEIPVYNENEDSELAKNTALDLGKDEAIHAVSDKIRNRSKRYVNISNKDLADCIDGYSIRNEVIGTRSYSANVTYRVNLTTLSNLLKNKKAAIDVIQNRNKLIVVDAQDISAVFSQINSALKKQQRKYTPYSFTKESVKYLYSSYLDELFNSFNIRHRYEEIH